MAVCYCYLISVGYDSASNACETGRIPADVAIIHIIIKAIGIHVKKSRLMKSGYFFTSKTKIAKANIDIVNTSSEQTNIILGLTFRIKKGVIPRKHKYVIMVIQTFF